MADDQKLWFPIDPDNEPGGQSGDSQQADLSMSLSFGPVQGASEPATAESNAGSVGKNTGSAGGAGNAGDAGSATPTFQGLFAPVDNAQNDDAQNNSTQNSDAAGAFGAEGGPVEDDPVEGGPATENAGNSAATAAPAPSEPTAEHPAPEHPAPEHPAPADIVDSRWDIPVIDLDLIDHAGQGGNDLGANPTAVIGKKPASASDGTTTLTLDSMDWLDDEPTVANATSGNAAADTVNAAATATAANMAAPANTNSTAATQTMPLSSLPTPTSTVQPLFAAPAADTANTASASASGTGTTPETAATLLFEPMSDDAIVPPVEPAHAKALKPDRRGPVIAASVAGVLVAAAALAGGGWYVINQRQTTEELRVAQQNCQSAAGKFADAQSQLDTAVQNASAASAITADQVADATTVDALKQTLQVAADLHGPAACATTMSAGQLNQLVASYNQATELTQQQATEVTNAAQAVVDSQTAKTQNDQTAAVDASRQQLTNALDEARTKFEDSRYQVADDQTRVKLQIAIANAQELIDNNSTDTAAMDEATQRLATTIANVDESMEEAERQAAAAEATPTPRRTTPTEPSESPSTTDTVSPSPDPSSEPAETETTTPTPSPSTSTSTAPASQPTDPENPEVPPAQ